MEKKKLRVCAYARVSTLSDQQESSYDNQVEIYTEKITNNPDWEFVGIYADQGLTGTKEERPEFQRMLKDAEKGKIDIILVKSISRFARNTLITISTIRRLQELGVAIIFEKENIDTSKPYSEMLLTLLSAFAQEESRNTSERVKRGKRMRAKNGEAGWNPIYGYKKEGNVPYVIVEEEASIVRRIFDEYEKGKSTHAIAKELNLENELSCEEKEWNQPTIQRMLMNERYAGDVLTNKEFSENYLTHKKVRNRGEVDQFLLEGHHEGIVTKEQFQRVRKIRELKDSWQYPFDNLLVCPCCGKSMKKKTIDGIAYWCCMSDEFYARDTRVREAAVKAYSQLELTGITDEKTIQIKTENPEMESAEYWWIGDLVREITFGKFTGRKDATVTVHWNCGVETTAPLRTETIDKTRQRIRKRSERGQPKSRKRSVLHVLPASS